MDRPTRIIDPEGEVIIVLSNPNAPFVQLSEDMITEDFVEESPETLSENEKRKKEDKEMVSSHWSDDFIPQPPEQPIEELVAEKPASEWSTSRWTVAEEAAFEEPAVEETAPAETGIAEELDGSCFRVQVSAKHLVLASPVFKETLKGGWKESLTYLQKGSVEITADSWDIEAFLILLHIIHGQYYQTPRKITLETLAQVAVLADYYDCREALDILVTTWINALEETIPKSYSRNPVLWLWVSRFFQLPAQFREATSTAMSWSNNWIDNLGLPIPDIVISKDTHAVNRA
ncbi:hypothetical protein CNMCM5878_004513 [Aspergillus fumigatiaffinis]|nr:hypothetical protein CNMCM5878_004513 [Aspergillus fumigatiaffinis]